MGLKCSGHPCGWLSNDFQRRYGLGGVVHLSSRQCPSLVEYRMNGLGSKECSERQQGRSMRCREYESGDMGSRRGIRGGVGEKRLGM